MKKIFLIFLMALFLGGGLFYLFFRQISKSPEISEIIKKTKTEAKPKGSDRKQPQGLEAKVEKREEKKAIFVPEWMLADLETVKIRGDEYDRLIYFGNERSLEKFIVLARSFQEGKRELWFTLKITALPEEKDWLEMVQKTIDIVKDYNLQGIILDLEITGLPTDNLVNQINDLVKYFYTAVKKNYIHFAVAVYGDTFYRKRPYDLQSLSENSDEVMVMAYDFHKSYGEPGPNFPFEKGGRYGYDFKTMISDFLRFIPARKITVIFGMYGYDWTVDEKQRPFTQAKPLTLKQIKEKFYLKSDRIQDGIGCQMENCLIKRDEASKETEIDYVISSKTPDEEGIYRLDYHIVWFEDEESVRIKTEFLREKGIGSVAYWAAGYF